MRRHPRARLVLALSLALLGGCSFSSPQDFVDVTDVVSASGLVQSNWHPGTGFLVDRSERLFLTTQRTAGPSDEVQIVFPVIADGKAVVRKTAWLSHAKDRTVKARVVIADSQRDLAVLRLDTVPDDVPELRLAKNSPAKGDALHFLGAGAKASQVWAAASSTVESNGPRSVPIEGGKTATNQMIELAMAGSVARGISGGAILNDRDELVGVIAGHDAQQGALLATDLSEIRPVLAAVYRSFGLYAYQHHEYDVALRYNDRALATWPVDALGFNERGAAWSQKDQFERAVADYSRALALEPKLTVAYRNRGSAYFHLGKYREAVADCSRAIELQPRYLSAYCIRRDAYSRLGMPKERQNDANLIGFMTQPEWKTVGGGGNPQYSPRDDSDDGDSSPQRTVTDADGRPLRAGGDAYWHGGSGQRYLAVGSYQRVMPGAGMPMR